MRRLLVAATGAAVDAIPGLILVAVKEASSNGERRKLSKLRRDSRDGRAADYFEEGGLAFIPVNAQGDELGLPPTVLAH